MVPFPLFSAGSPRDFSDPYCGNPAKLLEVNLTILWSLLEFLTLRLVHTELAAIYQSQFRVSYPSTGTMAISTDEALL